MYREQKFIYVVEKVASASVEAVECIHTYVDVCKRILGMMENGSCE